MIDPAILRRRLFTATAIVSTLGLVIDLQSSARCEAGYFLRAVTTNIRSISSRGASYSIRLLMPQTPRSPHL